MCGIAGETFQGAPAGAEWLARACALMAHRGPDGEGFHREPGVALGHRRLSIIDLARGAQPMSYAGGRYWITYNGEIYNYRELRAELERLGSPFETRSDTEVILAAYAAWGADCVGRLNGIFAFGLWDREARSLLLARDHLGVKPLLYHRSATGIVFASELKALLAHPQVGREVDAEALQHYLALGYVLAPRTILRDVHKLPPGHCLLATPERIRIAPYWDLAALARAPAAPGPAPQHVQTFEEVLDRTVARQMVSDVPLGAFLSGGIDSSTVSYYASRHAAGTLQTFSIGFDEPSFSELDYARAAATRIGSEHHEEAVPPPSLDQLAELVWYYDEPLGDTSIIPTYHLAKLARGRVTVALSGDGCDEILAGYDTYVADRLQSYYARVPRWLHDRVVRPAVAWLPSTYRKVSLDFKIKQFVEYGHHSAERAHYGWRSMLNPDERAALTGTGADVEDAPFVAYARHYAAVAGARPLNQALYVDLKTWLADDILTKVDRASMACSLEVRVPFLAPDLVECAMRLPVDLKLRGLRRKYILKEIMRDRLPRRIVRRRKRGFNAPVSIWLRDGLRDEVTGLLAERGSAIVDLSSPVVERLWREHTAGRADHGNKLWTILSLVLWERRVLP